MTIGGDGFYARIDPVGHRRWRARRYFVGNNSGGMSRCVTTAAAPASPAAPATRASRGDWSGDTQSFILPFDLFHGGVPGGDDCAPAGIPGGCGHLVAGTTRVWETIAGGNATMNAGELVRHEQPDDAEHDQADARQPLLHQPGQVLAQVVEPGDRRHERRATSGSASTSGRDVASQANWVNVTGRQHRPAEPAGARDRARRRRRRTRPWRPATRRSAASTPTRRRTPGHVFQVTCTANCATFTWAEQDAATCPTSRSTRSSSTRTSRQQVFAGTDWGVYYTDDITVASPTWFRFENGHAALDGLGPPDRPRRDDALGLDARPRRLCVAAAGRWASASASAAATTRASAASAASAATALSPRTTTSSTQSPCRVRRNDRRHHRSTQTVRPGSPCSLTRGRSTPSGIASRRRPAGRRTSTPAPTSSTTGTWLPTPAPRSTS